MTITVNGQNVPALCDLSIEPIQVGTQSRVASGRMVFDIVAIKQRISLQWLAMTETNLKHLFDTFSMTAIHVLNYPDPQGVSGRQTINVKVINRRNGRLRTTSGGIRYWTDIVIELEEQ